MRLLRLLVLALVVLLTLPLHFKPNQASRVLHDEGNLILDKELGMQSLQKGPVPPSRPSGCTNIPGSGGIGCPVKQMNVAGDAFRAYPQFMHMVPFAAATKHKKL
ncbi:putative Transmembrane protein [Quillaja saponaria]|uniref:Transmembrane protein n=1 Tax=Quillaja saponaria TaxID=32244 RepID=A0AAD7PGJ4_QUISA|nr:putative Transmembrane protein [Quillaja saponaria]